MTPEEALSQVRRCPPGEGQGAITNSPRKNESAGPKQKWCSAVDVSDGESKVQCCKEQYCIQLQETEKDKGAQCVAVYGVGLPRVRQDFATKQQNERTGIFRVDSNSQIQWHL